MAKLTTNELCKIVEGMLFASGSPLSLEAIYKRFFEEDKVKKDDVKKALLQLQKFYAERGIQLVEVATGFRFQVGQEVIPYITNNLSEKPARFSRALLETLALIAYRQPITRGEIEDIRGVVVSTHLIKTLDELEWIRVVGHKDVPGKPALYATTKDFLDHFGLKNLEDLPPLAALKDFDSIGSEMAQNAQIEDLPFEVKTSIPLPEEEIETEGALGSETVTELETEVEVESEDETA